MIVVQEQWQALLSLSLKGTNPQIIYIIGNNDSGKSTLSHFLLTNLSKHFPTAYIDCDPGQSSIGLPTTIGLAIYPQQPGTKPARYFRFVGATSPVRHWAPTLVGIKKLSEQALTLGAQRIIVDSCGYVLGHQGREFQFQVIDLLKPDYIVPIQNSNEIELLLSNFNTHPDIKISRINPSPQVIPRTQEQRQKYRIEKFNKYFKNAYEQNVSIKGTGFHGKTPDLKNRAEYKNLLIGLCDTENYLLNLGILDNIDLKNEIMDIYAPPADHKKIVSIHFGSIYLDRGGRQMEPPIVTTREIVNLVKK